MFFLTRLDSLVPVGVRQIHWGAQLACPVVAGVVVIVIVVVPVL